MTRASDLKAGTSGIEDFFIEYLGTPSQPVSFGGRTAELASLNTWLADPHTSPYALLSGRAGSGKSTLLAHWANALAQQGQTQVIFYPISLRFNTALKSVIFATLGTRLAEIYGEPVQQVDLSAEQWCEVCRSYLNRTPPDRPLLIILDGLDQAIDWQPAAGLFPTVPPPGLRVVASVRSQEEGDPTPSDWLQRLNWHRPGFRLFLLAGLNREGVKDVLAANTANPERVLIRETVTDDLFRLSQGDPLVLRLYSEAITLGVGSPSSWLSDDLTSLKPGLAGYIQQWGTKLRRQSHTRLGLLRAVLGLVNLCATALGPLSRADMLHLAPDFFGESQLLDEAIHLTAGLIIEDKAKQHYVFRHLRLGEFFTAHLPVRERQAWQARFLHYGRETLAALEAGTLRPSDAPAYVIQYYGAHLDQAAVPPQEFYALLNQPWLAAWLHLEQSYSGFLNDIERAWQQAEVAGNLPIQILCALSQASVATLSANVHPLVLAKAVELGVITPAQALAIARQKPRETHYIQALIELFPYLPEGLLKFTLTELKATSDSWKITALLKLTSYLTREEEKKEAMQAAWKEALFSDDVFTQLGVLHQIIPYFPELSDLQTAVAEQAMNKALTMPRTEPHDDSPKIGALIRIAPYLSPEPQKRALLKAYNLATELDDKASRARFLVDLAPQMPAVIKLDVARRALWAVINDLGDLCPISEHVENLVILAPHLPDSLHEEALGATEHLGNPAIRAEALAALLSRLAAPLQEVALTNALIALQQVKDNYEWVMAVSRLAGFLPETLKLDLLDKAVKLARAETRPVLRARQLAHAGIHLAGPLKTEVLREALAVVLKFEDEYYQSRVLPIFVSHLTPELLGEVLGKRSAADESARTKILSDLALHLASTGALEEKLLPEALAAILALPEREDFDKSPRAEGLIILAPYLPDSLRAEALGVVQAMPQTREDEKILRVKSLIDLFPYLSDHFREKIIQDILSGIRELPKDKPIDKDWPKLMGYHGLQQLPKPFQTKVWQEILAVIEAVPVEEWRGSALIALTPALPGNLKETALIIVKGMTQEETRMRNLVKIVPYLPDNLLPEAWAILSTVNTLPIRTEGMIGLVSYLPDTLLAEALTLIRASKNWPQDRATILTSLLPYLPDPIRPGIWDEVLQIARELDRPDKKAEVMVGIVPHLPETMRNQVVAEALVVIRQMKGPKARLAYDYPQAHMVAGLAPYLPAGQMQHEALAIVQSIPTPEARVEGWVGLAPHLPLQLQADIVVAAQQMKDEYLQAGFLISLMPHLPGSLQARLVEMTLAMQDDPRRAQTIGALAPYLPGALKTTALQEALTAAKMIHEEWDRVELVRKLLPYLPEVLWSEFFVIVQRLEYKFLWQKLLSDAGPYMSGQAKAEALRLACTSDPLYSPFKALAVPLAEWARSQPHAAYKAWQETLRHLVTQSRQDVLNALHNLMPFTLALVNEHERAMVAVEIFRVIKKVETWWP